MSLAYAILAGSLFAVAIYLLLRESVVDHVFGIVMLGHAANLIVFGAGRLVRGAAPVLEGERAVADPLPQALVLTAIVIGFGVAAYATAVVARLTETRDTDEVDHLEEDADAA